MDAKTDLRCDTADRAGEGDGVEAERVATGRQSHLLPVDVQSVEARPGVGVQHAASHRRRAVCEYMYSE